MRYDLDYKRKVEAKNPTKGPAYPKLCKPKKISLD